MFGDMPIDMANTLNPIFWKYKACLKLVKDLFPFFILSPITHTTTPPFFGNASTQQGGWWKKQKSIERIETRKN
jgi:hypothetical protein